MNWTEVCAYPHLHDLPYKIELNEQGQMMRSGVAVIAEEACFHETTH